MGAPATRPKRLDRGGLPVAEEVLLPAQRFAPPVPRTGLRRLAVAVLLDACHAAGLVPNRGVGWVDRLQARRYLTGRSDGTEPLPLGVACQLVDLGRRRRGGAGAPPLPRGRR